MNNFDIKKRPMLPGSSEETILVNQSGIVIYMNNEAINYFGYESGYCVYIQELIPDIKLGEIEEGYVLQFYGKHREGYTFPLFLKVNSFISNNKQYFLFIIHNVRDQSKMDKELSQPLNELIDLKYAIDEAAIVAITDHKGVILYVNEQFCSISQYTANELIGRDHRMINSGYHSQEFMSDLWRTISSGKVWRGELRNKAKDGSYYWVDTTIVPFMNEKNKPYQFLAIRQDVTDHKRVVEELQTSIKELSDLKLALDESSIVAITNSKGKITYVNDQFCQISKFSKQELLGKDHRIINSNYHSKTFFQNLWEKISNGQVWKGELRNKAKDGTIYWVDTTIVPFMNEEGIPYQYLAIRYEITERKRVEEELQRMMTRIIDVQEEERKVLSRNLHDGIGQNLYSHLITISRLQAEIDHPLLQQMHDETSNLIKDVREISWELRPSVLDDLGLLPAIRSYLVRYAEFYEIDVEFECGLLTRLDSNAELTIYRIIQEALTNIRKYAYVDKAKVIMREEANHIRVLIEDNGQGFDHKSNSSGVGIFSMEERAKSAGGLLEIYSAPMKGTKIVLELPKSSLS
ncbi:PAS domain-containing protein [Peribacillus sp. FSL H8-0477]|uniref:PAS domain S-box protein n=1 Tax=Peribacillus sp. FSL H8-0477 TaxID=2921388 RepID=UPI0030F7042D